MGTCCPKFEFCGDMLSKIWILWGNVVQNFFSGLYHDIMTPCQVSEILVIVFIFLIFFKRRSNTNLKYFSYTVQFETTYQNKFSFPMSYKTKEQCMFQNLSENNEKLHLCSIKWRDLVQCLRNLHEICWVCEDFDTKCFKTLWIFFSQGSIMI